MFAFSVTFKLLSWCLALKFGDNGRASRPWILGVSVGLVFAIFDVMSDYQGPRNAAVILVTYLVSALVIMHIYYRTQSAVLSLLIAAIGTGILFLGAPYFVATILSPNQ